MGESWPKLPAFKKGETLSKKQPKIAKRTGGVTQLGEHLPSKWKALKKNWKPSNGFEPEKYNLVYILNKSLWLPSEEAIIIVNVEVGKN